VGRGIVVEEELGDKVAYSSIADVNWVGVGMDSYRNMIRRRAFCWQAASNQEGWIHMIVEEWLRRILAESCGVWALEGAHRSQSPIHSIL